MLRLIFLAINVVIGAALAARGRELRQSKDPKRLTGEAIRQVSDGAAYTSAVGTAEFFCGWLFIIEGGMLYVTDSLPLLFAGDALVVLLLACVFRALRRKYTLKSPRSMPCARKDENMYE